MSRILPILFNTDMVRAILDGRKTVTRRLVKLQPDWFDCGIKGDRNTPMRACDVLLSDLEIKPSYQPGDILYVRETWKYYEKAVGKGEGFHIGKFLAYKADEDKYKEGRPSEWYEGKWKPSIHMPKPAARIWLKVTDVRVERLQDISEEQCLREGIVILPEDIEDEEFGSCPNVPIFKYSILWGSTIGKSAIVHSGWNANPWVWVIEFERCEKPEDKSI